MVCDEVLCDRWYVVKFNVMGGMWCVLCDCRYVVRVLCDGWYVVKFYVMGGMWLSFM